ncbi:GNAT superfamily N-acetyltransferase [Paenibacillus mucilaginosus]|uniref:GNAT family N-acetyltransferase n=1 Tax=Paenibacillus mucilaginosus TaxID=61624 RepID=UPI003D1A5FCD
MSLHIRCAEPQDLLPLSGLMHDYIVGFYGNPWPGDDRIHNLIRSLLERQAGVQFVAEREGALIGFATLYFTYSTMKANPITIMNDFFLLEPYRGTEAQTRLFAHCRSFSLDNGFSYMSWITGTGNERAQHFFDEAGALRGSWVNYSIV